MPVVIRAALSTAASGTQDITSSGVGTIAAAEFWAIGGTADDTSANDAYQSYGFTDGTREAANGYSSEHSPTRSNCSRNQRDDRVITFPNFAGSAEEMGFSFDSFITDGVRLTIDTQASSAWYVVVRLWTDAEIDNAYVDSVTLNASTSALDITAPGFEPDLVKTSGSALSTSVPHIGVNILWFWGMGINDGSDTQKSMFLSESDNAASAVVAARAQNAMIAGQMTTSGAMTYTTTIGSYDSNGFSLTSAGSPQADIVSYLALKFTGTPQLALLDVDWPTGGNINEETPGFQPDTVEIMSGHFLTAYNTSTTSTVASTGTTVFDGTSIFTNQTMIEDASALMDTSSRSSSKAIVRNYSDASTIIDSSGFSLDSLGYNITLTSHPGTANKAFSLSVKTDPATGTDIDGNLETITLTTSGAGISSARDVAAALESIDLTAHQATIDQATPTDIAAGLESLSLATFDAGISTSRDIAASTESITLDAHAASITTGAVVDATLENITLTALGATIFAARDIAASLQAISVATFAAEVASTVEVDLGRGRVFPVSARERYFSVSGRTRLFEARTTPTKFTAR